MFGAINWTNYCQMSAFISLQIYIGCHAWTCGRFIDWRRVPTFDTTSESNFQLEPAVQL